MSFKYKTRIIKTFMGDCLVITDTSTNKNIELMRVQANSILKRFSIGCMSGSFPHGNYSILEDVVNLYHDKDTENHDIDISVADLLSILKDNKGVKNEDRYISEKDI